MLLRFKVANYLSFKETACLDMEAEALKEKKTNLHIPYLYNPRLFVLKSAVIYGHNSHGKTNFIKAYSFFRQFVLSSFSLGKTQINTGVEPFFFNTATREKPSYFEVSVVIKHTRYRYGFEATEKKVLSEWLYYAESGVRENILFLRHEQEYRDISKLWNKTADGKIESAKSFTKPNNLFLSVLLTHDNIPRVEELSNWLKGNVILTGNYGSDVHGGADKIYSKPEYRDLILNFINSADLGFTNIFDKISNRIAKGIHEGLVNFWFETEKDNFDLYVQHPLFDEHYRFLRHIELDLEKNESSGSIKYFIISCFLSYVIKSGQLIWIDELDASLHTALFALLVNKYNDPKTNVTGSQMICTTHNTILLDKQLRRDQFLFVHKNEYGESVLTRMHTADTPVRIKKSVEGDYRVGDLGGVSDKVVKTVRTLFDKNDD